MLHEAAGMNLPEVRMRVLKHRRDPAAVNSRLIRRPIQRMFWLFLLPMTAAFCIGFVYPFLKGLFLSFCKFKTTSKWTWVGLSNYVKAFHDESFLYSASRLGEKFFSNRSIGGKDPPRHEAAIARCCLNA